MNSNSARNAAQELARCRQRLAELEQTLAAIRRGQVDAVVVEGPDGPQVFTLRGADRTYRLLVEQMGQGALVLEPDGTVLYANRRAADMLGQPLRRLVGTKAPACLAAEQGQTLLEHLEAGEPSFTMEVDLPGPGGNALPALATAAAVSVEDRHLYCLVLTDLSQQRQLQQVTASEELLRAVLAQALDAVFVCDRRGVVILANEAARRLAGRNPVSRHFDSLLQLRPCEEEGRGWDFGAIQARGRVQTERVCLDDGGGQVRHLLLSGGPALDSRGHPLATVISLLEITAHVEADEALKESEARYRLLFDSILDPVIITSLEEEPEAGRVLEVNRAACERYGYTREEFLRLRRSDWVAPAGQEAIAARVAAVRRAGGLILESVHRTREGEEFPVELHSHAIDYQGRPAMLSVIRDLTERRQLKARLHLAQKMEAVGRLAGGVAHDFNNVLTAILGNVDLALLDADSDRPLTPYLEEIKKAAHRAADLTRQLLAFSRKQVAQPRVIDPSRVILDLEKMLRRLIGEDIELAIEIEPGLLPVRLDPAQLEQVIMNLVVNSRDAMPTGGKLTIKAATLLLDRDQLQEIGLQADPGPFLHLLVRDTGVGMDQATLERIFEPFFTTKQPGVGTGLGLATVYGIVTQNNGTILASSQPGRGTTMEIYLPATIEEPEEDGGPKAIRSAQGSETVLLVEDDQLLRAAAKRGLEAHGYRVLAAESGPAALEVARSLEGPLHLLVTDVVMPKMGGRELAARLLAARPDMKVLFISGYPDDTISRHGLVEESIAFLGKPFTPADLALAVRQILDRPAT